MRLRGGEGGGKDDGTTGVAVDGSGGRAAGPQLSIPLDYRKSSREGRGVVDNMGQKSRR